MAHFFFRLRRSLPTLCNLRHSPLLNTSISSSLSSQHTSSFMTSIVQSWRSYSTSVPFSCPCFDVMKDVRTEYQDIRLLHWQVVMLFPPLGEPTPEDILGICEDICAKGLNISLEEAKKRIYACTISPDSGLLPSFRVVMTPKQRFRFYDLSYVYSIHRDYCPDEENWGCGGEFKYTNGAIMPNHCGSLQSCPPQGNEMLGAPGQEEIGGLKPVNNRDEVHVF